MFARALDFRRPESFLYYWQDSATIRFLRHEGPELLQLRSRIRRNVQLNLQHGFAALGTRAGQTLWGLPEWIEPPSPFGMPDPDTVWVSLAGLRGRAQIRAVLEAAEVPLTRAQIADVIERSHGFAAEVSGEHVVATTAAGQEADLLSAELHTKAEQFFAQLTPLERRMLVVRGYTDTGNERVSFRQVADQLGGRTPESFRQKEHQIFAAFRSRFDRDEIRDAARCLIELLASDVGNEPSNLDPPR